MPRGNSFPPCSSGWRARNRSPPPGSLDWSGWISASSTGSRRTGRPERALEPTVAEAIMLPVSEFFAWAHLAVAGIAADIAGAVILGLSFSTKSPEQMREEVPVSVTTVTTPGHISIPFPSALLESMIRQRAEARVGLVFLVVGFALQASVYFFTGGRFATLEEKLVAGALAALIWALALLTMKMVVPWDEQRTRVRIPDGIPLYRGPFGDVYETRGGEHRRTEPPDRPRVDPPPSASEASHEAEIAREVDQLVSDSGKSDEEILAGIQELTKMSEQDARLLLARARGQLEELESMGDV